MRLSNQAGMLLLAAITFSSAHASVVYKKNHWSLEDNSSRANPNGPCVMVTKVKKNRVNYRLEFIHLKNAQGPTELQITQQGSGGAQAMTATLSNGKTLSFATLRKQGSNTVLWNIPQGIGDLVSYFERSGELRMQPADGSRDAAVNFEDAGFAQVKAEFQKRCLGNASLVDSNFEATFLKSGNRAIDPMALTIDTVNDLRSLLTQGHAAYSSISANQIEINSLRNRFAVQLSEAGRLSASVASLSSQIAASREDSNRAEVARLEKLIPQQNAAVQSAVIARDRAESAIAPFRADHSAHENAARGARASANGAQQDISEINRTIGQNQTQIRQLENDRRAALRAASEARQDIPRAESDLRIADRQFRAYDADADYRQRVHTNPRWREARAALPTARAEENEYERLRDTAHDDKERKEDIKKACQRVRGQDCSAQIAAHAEALALYRRYEAEEDRKQARRRGLESTISSIETQARNGVNAIVSELRGRLDSANATLAGLQNSMTRNEDLAQRIAYQTIPSLNNEITRLERSLPRAEAELRRSLPEASRLEGILADYERRVGWASKSKAVESTQQLLDQRTNELSASMRSQDAAIQSLANVQNLKSQLSLAQSQLIQVNQSLEPFNQANLSLQAQTVSLNENLQNLVQQFDSKLP